MGQGEWIRHVRPVEAEHLVGHNGGQGREQHDQDEEKQAGAHQELVQGVAQGPGRGEHRSPGSACRRASRDLGDGFAALHPGLHRCRGGVSHAGSAHCPRLTGTLLPQGFGGACKVPRRLPELVLSVSELLFVGLRHGFSPPGHS